MRITVLGCLCLMVSSSTWAAPIFYTDTENSRLEFVGSAVHEGLSEFMGLNLPAQWQFVDGYFEARSGPETLQTVTTDGLGTVTHSEYLYNGGTFKLDLTLKDVGTGTLRSGSFVAPIVGSMTVSVDERGLDGDHDVTVSYDLGRGWFDPSIASALGIPRRSSSGSVFDPYLTFGTGDYQSSDRTAWEGSATVSIEAPEPGLMLLMGSSCLALLWRERRRRRLAARTE